MERVFPLRIPPLLSTFAALAALGLTVASCGSSDQDGKEVKSVTVSGQGSFSDGTPVGGQKVQYQLIVDGSLLFQEGVDGCRPTPAHVAGTVIQNATSDIS